MNFFIYDLLTYNCVKKKKIAKKIISWTTIKIQLLIKKHLKLPIISNVHLLLFFNICLSIDWINKKKLTFFKYSFLLVQIFFLFFFLVIKNFNFLIEATWQIIVKKYNFLLKIFTWHNSAAELERIQVRYEYAWLCMNRQRHQNRVIAYRLQNVIYSRIYNLSHCQLLRYIDFILHE